MYTSLNSPLTMGPLVIRNRNIMSALTRNRSLPRDIPNEFNLEYYLQRAKGGVGLIISEGALISRQGTEWPHAPGIWNDDHVEGWKKITKAVHEAGALIFCQLWQLGRANHPDMPEQKASGDPVWGPSAISARGGKFRLLPGIPGYVTPTAITDPWIVIKEFKNAAQKAKEAGFDGVEVHAASGYLIDEFLDTTSNNRTDEWGGSVENRARFCLEVVKVVIEVWGPERVGVKLTPTGGYNDMGMPLQDALETFGYVIKTLDEMKIAYITLVQFVAATNPSYDGIPRATIHNVLESYRSLIKHPKIFLNGAVTPNEAEELIKSGRIDGAVFGTLWIGHPDMHNRLLSGKPLDAVLDIKNVYYQEEMGRPIQLGYTDYPAVT